MEFLSKLFKKKEEGQDTEKGATHEALGVGSASVADIPWGTTQPAMVLIDGAATRVRAWGKFAYTTDDPQRAAELTVASQRDDVARQLRTIIVKHCQDALGELAGNVGSVAELAGQGALLAEQIRTRALSDFYEQGMTLQTVTVEGVQGA